MTIITSPPAAVAANEFVSRFTKTWRRCSTSPKTVARSPARSIFKATPLATNDGFINTTTDWTRSSRLSGPCSRFGCRVIDNFSLMIRTTRFSSESIMASVFRISGVASGSSVSDWTCHAIECNGVPTSCATEEASSPSAASRSDRFNASFTSTSCAFARNSSARASSSRAFRSSRVIAKYATLIRTPATTLRLMTAATKRPGLCGRSKPEYVAAIQSSTVMSINQRLRAVATSRIGSTNAYAATTLAGVPFSITTMRKKRAAATPSTSQLPLPVALGVSHLSHPMLSRGTGDDHNGNSGVRQGTALGARLMECGGDGRRACTRARVLDRHGKFMRPVGIAVQGPRHVDLGLLSQQILDAREHQVGRSSGYVDVNRLRQPWREAIAQEPFVIGIRRQEPGMTDGAQHARLIGSAFFDSGSMRLLSRIHPESRAD